MYERVKDLAFEDHTQINVRVPKAWMKCNETRMILLFSFFYV